MYKGVCQTDWKDAKNICSSLGGRLPNIDELRAEVRKCGGIIDSYKKNRANKSYQACYKNNGFNNNDWYWSSTTYKGNSGNAWIVYFDLGSVGNYYKSFNIFVRCVRAGE